MNDRQSALRRTAIVVLGLGIVWGLIVVGSIVQPNYDSTLDSISALASRGAQAPWIGALAIMAAGVLTMGSGLLSVRFISPPGFLALVVSGAALVLISVSPINCPQGAAGCHMGIEGSDWFGRMHLVGVGIYQVGFVTATASCALSLWRAGARGPALVAAVGVIASMMFFTFAPIAMGTLQRAWLIVHSLLLAGLPFMHPWLRQHQLAPPPKPGSHAQIESSTTA